VHVLDAVELAPEVDQRSLVNLLDEDRRDAGGARRGDDLEDPHVPLGATFHDRDPAALRGKHLALLDIDHHHQRRFFDQFHQEAPENAERPERSLSPGLLSLRVSAAM